MASIEKQVEREKKIQENPSNQPSKIKGIRGDIDDEDDEESYYRYEIIKFQFM